MPLNPIFWTLFLIVTLAVIVTMQRRRSRKADDGETREGPVPGYSWTPGSRLVLESGESEKPMPVRARSVETFHTPERARVIVSLELDPSLGSDEAATIMERVAREIYRRSEAHAVLIEGHGLVDEGGARRRIHSALLLAPDGRGWWGDEPVTRLDRR